MAYNPFDKPIGEPLEADDLKVLIDRQVAEGYFVEYKEAMPRSDKIARSVASFANTYGGWYIVGVKSDQRNVATDIPGFSLNDIRNPISNITESVKSNMDPVAVFYAQVVALEGDNAALVVFVPPNQETPFITKDGRIYRRVHDSSDPLPENSRYSVDRLVDSGRERIEAFERFCLDERNFSQGESKQAWANIFLTPQACAPLNRYEVGTSEGMRKLLDETHQPCEILQSPEFGNMASGLPFNYARPTHQSVILRQVQAHAVAYGSFTLELFMDGRAKVHLPIQQFILTDRREVQGMESPALRSLLTGMLDQHWEHTALLKWFDFGELVLALATVFTFYEQWLGEDKQSMHLKAGIWTENLWRGVPFFDSDEWAQHAERFGLPMIDRDEIKIPERIGRGIMLDFSTSPTWMQLAIPFGLGLGLPIDLLGPAMGRAVANAAARQAAV